MVSNSRMSDQELDEFQSIRKKAGRNIDPATAEVYWEYGQPGDPYRVIPDRSEEEQTLGRVWFARSPGSNIWVAFSDLPEATCKALQEQEWREPPGWNDWLWEGCEDSVVSGELAPNKER